MTQTTQQMGPRIVPTPAVSVAEQRFDEIVRTHRPALLAFTTRLVGGDTGRAEDVVQETFARAWRRIDRLTPEHGSVNSWLRRVASNIAIDGHRMRQVRPAEVELQHHDTPMRQDGTDGTDQILARMVVRDMLSSIWPEHRAVLEEVYLNDRTAAEAAAVLGIPVGTVKSRLFYALRALRGNALESGLRAS
jgi:RNA polymerase sigma-70 factor (ECF subfamily)